LSAPAQGQLTHGRAVGGDDLDSPSGGTDRVSEPFCCAPRRGFVIRPGRTIEPYDSVYVDSRSLLILGNTGKGQSSVPGEVRLHNAGGGGEAPPYVDDEPVPQLGGVRVPQHVGGVVVAVGAQRLADERGVRSVDGTAAKETAVFAGAARPAGATCLPGAVNRTERRRGQSDEEPRSVPDRWRDVLAAEEARADEVEGVSGVEAGAGRADGGPAVAAADEEAFAGFVAGVVVVEDLAGRAV